MQDAELKKNDADIGLQCEVKSNNGYGRISLGKLGNKFNVNDKVYVLTDAEYHSLLMQSSTTDDRTTSEDIENKFEKLLKISLEPIDKTHKEQLLYKDNQLNEKDNQLNAMQQAFIQFNTRINQLNAIDILFRKKHHKIINDFSNSIWIKAEDKEMVNADVKQVTSKDD